MIIKNSQQEQHHHRWCPSSPSCCHVRVSARTTLPSMSTTTATRMEWEESQRPASPTNTRTYRPVPHFNNPSLSDPSIISTPIISTRSSISASIPCDELILPRMDIMSCTEIAIILQKHSLRLSLLQRI